MNDKLCIFACNSLAAEVSHVLKSGNYPDVKLQSYPVNCVGSPLNNERILSLTSKEETYSKIIFFASACQLRNAEKHELPSNIKLISLEQCFELVINKEIIYHFIKQGYYLITNGWLRNYKHHLNEWGFPDQSAKRFFGESLHKILFLDTGIDQDYLPKLTAVSEYMDLAYEVFPVGLSHCKNFIDSEVSAWRAEEEGKYINVALARLTKENADYFFVFQQMQKLVDYTDETTIINEMFALLNILFAPKQIGFRAYNNNLENATVWFNSNTTNLNKTQTDFMVIEITHQNEILGIFEIYGIRFPEYIDQYRNIKPVISKICGVSITNARKYSELEHAKLAITESEKRFHSLFDNMAEGVALHELEFLAGNPVDYRIIDTNARFGEILGIAPKQVVGKLSTVAYNSDAPPYFDEYIDVVINKKSIFFETYFASLDKHFAISAVPWQENGFATIFTDITERQKNEEKLIKLSTAVEQSPVSIVITDNEGNIEYGNPIVFELTGYTPEEVLGENPRIFSSGEKSAGEYKELWSNILSGKIWTGEFHNKKKNGELYWEQASISSIKNAKGEITNFLAVKADVTEYKRIVKAIKKSEEKYRLITENTGDVIWIFNLPKQKFTFMSPSIFSLRGYTAEEAMMQTLEESFTPESSKLISALIEKTLPLFFEHKNTNQTRQINAVQQPCKNGKVIWVEAATQFQFNSDGQIEILGVSRNIENRKRMEQELLANEARLKELNAEKDKFFSIIAHDLKSPFNSILGFSELLVEQAGEKNFEGIERFAEIIRQSSEQAMDLLSNLMDWSRSQTGRMEFNPEYFEMVSLINEVVPLFENIAGQKSITLKKNFSSKIPVFADKAMISTVLRNLVSNAIKFSKPSSEIIISAKTNQKMLTVSVADSGVGIPKHNLVKLFRIDQNYSTKGTNNEKGTGLGLILCKEFIEKHGGRIWVESEAGKGSTFYFTLPGSLKL